MIGSSTDGLKVSAYQWKNQNEKKEGAIYLEKNVKL